MLLSGAAGFIALAYEIVWYRLYSFASSGKADSFALLLACYLLGVACGSLAVRDLCRQKYRNNVRLTMRAASHVVIVGTVVAFLLGPLLARAVVHVPVKITYSFVFIAATLLGSIFPLLSHAAVDPAKDSGRQLSFLYLSNIVGSTLGSFLVGFVVLNYFSTRATSVLLLGLGLIVASVLAFLAGPAKAGQRGPSGLFATGCAACLALALTSGLLFNGMYERLLFKGIYRAGMTFSNLVENRSGVIAVYPESAEFGYPTNVVYSGGVYDGRFNTGLMRDSNGLFRAFAISGLQAKPKSVLIIGLASGSWAQVVASNPNVEDVTIVEINPGYLPLIRQYPEVESLLYNPRVHIVIDDGRRWLVGHPDRRFDFILMNTSFNWRANMTNLLSTEFMGLLRSHMNPGGIAYYNTTWSTDVLATGVTAFPYALRISSFLAVSDSAFTLDKDLWRTALTNYRIDGHPVFDLADPLQRTRLEDVLHLADELDASTGGLESRTSLQSRLKGARLITDDNMGTEWH
jgi:predicted membrane-bound spermidine synthase